jgi:hypothetical protein
MFKKLQGKIIDNVIINFSQNSFNNMETLESFISIKKFDCNKKLKQALVKNIKEGIKDGEPSVVLGFFASAQESKNIEVKKWGSAILFDTLIYAGKNEGMMGKILFTQMSKGVKQEIVDMFLSKRKLKGEAIKHLPQCLPTYIRSGVDVPLKKVFSALGKTASTEIRSASILGAFAETDKAVEYIKFINGKKPLTSKEIEALFEKAKLLGDAKGIKVVNAVFEVLTEKKGIGGRKTPIKVLSEETREYLTKFLAENNKFATQEAYDFLGKPNVGGVITKEKVEVKKNELNEALGKNFTDVARPGPNVNPDEQLNKLIFTDTKVTLNPTSTTPPK